MFGKRNYFNKNKKIGFKRAISFFIFFIFVVGFIFSAVYVPQILAQGNTDVAGMNQLTKIGLPQQDLVVVIMNIIRVVLGFLGIIGVILVIYAGFVWMTSKGEEEKITKAKKILINATIGLIITLSAFAIVHFVIQSILNKVLETATSSTYSSTTSGNVSFIPSFVVKWVDPKNNETNVFLCRSIQVGFSDKLNVDTINANNILIKIKDGKKENEICNIKKDCASGKCETNKCIGETVSGSFTVMSDVFRFRAEKDFEENATYQVEITTNVKSEKNRAISSIDSKRRWIFATGSLSDTTPPKVNQVYPENNGTNVCLTTPIQSIFNEPMDVISLMNKDALKIDPRVNAGFSHNVNNADTLIASPNELYQKNQKYTPLLNSDVITDSCGNFLDGDADGVAEKSPIDDYAPPPITTDPITTDPNWAFTTGTQAYCKPEITSITSNGYYDGDKITISGNYFTIAGNAIFNNNVYSNSDCFDSDFYPNGVCVSKWEDNKIELKVPSGGGVSNGAINGGIWVEVGEFLSNGKDFNVSSPHINWISPENGGKGSYITLSGTNFGSVQGKVYLVKQSDHKIKTEVEFPCSNSWTNNQIIIKIPEATILGEYYLQIKTSDNYYSNINNFVVNNDLPGPGICSSNPICGTVGTDVTLSGERLGNNTNGKVYFGKKIAVTTLWNETEIKTKTPQDIESGNNIIKIILNEGLVNEVQSNELNFQFPCESGDSCDTDITTSSCDSGACSTNQLCNSTNCVCQARHCFNNTKDEDKGETGIDCGGVCNACLYESCGAGASCSGNKKCCSDQICRPKCPGDSCQINLECNPNLVSVPGQTWDGGFEEDIASWRMGGQLHSWTRIENIEAYGGGRGIHIHQDPNQDYPGMCGEEICKDMSGCMWLPTTNQCKFNNGDIIKGWVGPVYYDKEEILKWGNTHRVMWISLIYNTVPLNLVSGKTYIYSFYYKGRSAGNLNMSLSYGIGWHSQCWPKGYAGDVDCKKLGGECEKAPGTCCAQIPYQKKCYPSIWLGSVPAGSYLDWRKFSKIFVYTNEMARTFNRAGALSNEIGMSMGYNSTGSLGTDLYIDNVQLEEGVASSDLTCCQNICKTISQCRVYLPVIDSILPINGKVASPVTTYVTIRGKNFGQTQGASKVYFGNSIASATCQTWSNTEIVVAAPFGITGVTPVKIVTDQGESNRDKNFTVNMIVKPSICSLSPNHGKAGDKITISGTNFGDSQINETYKSQVFFENIEAQISSWNNEKIEVVVPVGITIRESRVKVILKWRETPNGTSSNEVSFYMSPFVNSISPDKGPKDSYVTIRGGNFGQTQGLNRVVFNGVSASLAPCSNAWSDTEIIVLAPNSTTGPVAVEVTLPNNVKIKSNEKNFTYNNEPLCPGICEVIPNNEIVGAIATIKGSEFGETKLQGEGVTFNGINANVNLTNPDDWTNSEVKTKVPQTISGDVVITKIKQRDSGKKECRGGVYVLGICVGGSETSIMENVILKSNPVWFEVKKETAEIAEIAKPVCGNNKKETGEVCDGTDLDNKTCVTQGKTGGVLVCNSNCLEFNTNQCQVSLPNPIVETFYPKNKAIDVCINREISATFNHLMNKETLNSGNISLTKGGTAVAGTIINRDENNKTTTIFSPTNYLDKNVEYKMTIKKEVKNKEGLTMENDKIWTFTTGTTLCQINHIKITINDESKNDDLFTCADNNCSGDQDGTIIGNQHKYIAQAQDKDNYNISANYIWSKQDANGIILSITPMPTIQTGTQLVTSQRINGEAIILVQANATDILSKATEIKVRNFMCENPWEFGTPTEAILKDNETGFELFYCRDR